MAEDHTRKYNDWHIERPHKKVCVPSSEATPQEIEKYQSSEEVVEENSNPFVVNNVAQNIDTSNIDGSARTAPFLPHQNQGEDTTKTSLGAEGSSQDGAGGVDIDPETGLPIPDYMKPFINN